MKYEELRDLLNDPIGAYVRETEKHGERANLEAFDASIQTVMDRLEDDNGRRLQWDLTVDDLTEGIFGHLHMLVNDLQSGSLQDQADLLSTVLDLVMQLAKKAGGDPNRALSWFYVSIGNEVASDL